MNPVIVKELVKGSGEWWIFFEQDGRRKRRKVNGDRQLAELVADQIRKILETGDTDIPVSSVNRANYTFAEYSTIWLEDYIKSMRKASTYERYNQLLRDYILPAFSKMELADINRGDVRDFISRMNLNLSSSSVLVMRDVISGVFNHAIDDEIITVNPCSGILKRMKLERRSKPKINPYTKEEMNQFLEFCRQSYSAKYPLFLCAFKTGLRIGELLALEWKDIDFKKKKIAVGKSFRRGVVGETKTGKDRKVDMTDQLCKVLQGLHSERKRVEIVFHESGKRIPQNTLRRLFSRITDNASMRKIRFHDIRHTYGSLMVSSGAALNYVKEQMGHSKISITVDTYGAYIPQSGRALVNLLDD
jgi:integrase